MSEAAGNGSFALAEFVVVNAELQPSDAERYEAAIMHYLTEANAKISEQLAELRTSMDLSLIHISEPTRLYPKSRMPSSA